MSHNIAPLHVGTLSAVIALLIAACGSPQSTPAEPAPAATAASAPTAAVSEPASAPVTESSSEPPPATGPVAAPNSAKAPSGPPPAASVPLDPKEAELAAYRAAKPVFEANCADCHTRRKNRRKQKKGVKHFTMNAYPFGGHHAYDIGRQIRKSLGVDGGKATMPKDDPGTLSASDLALIVAWTRAFDATHPPKAGGHGHHAHGL